MDRIVYLLSIEASKLQDFAKGEVAGIIDEAFRKLHGTDATSSSMNGERFLEVDNPKPKVVQKMIRCPCGSSLPIEPMIQCVDPNCGVLQHMSCVIIPDGSSEETTLWRHYCEICRLNRADPFRATVKHLLSPVKLMTLSIPHDGSNPVQNVETTFQLCKTDKNFLRHNDYNVQVWCILLNDKVPFRMQWPLYADLKVNGVPVRTVTRPGSQLLGANGRDDGPMIAFYMVDGLNRISLSGWDARSFCLGVRIVKENTVQQILDLILTEQNNETFEDALARVQRCIGGGMAKETEDSDSDLEVISDYVGVNLRCPMGGYRIKTAGRFRPCAHMGCFDLETFVQLNQRSRKWQCPICLKNYSLEDIMVDPYFNRITKMMEKFDEDVTEIEVKFDGSWRVKKGDGFENIDQWRLGNIDDRKNSEVVAAMSSSSFEGHKDGENNLDNNSSDNLDVIVLSDSDEETPSLLCSEPVSNVRNDDSAPRIPNVFTESLPCDEGLSSSALDASVDSSLCHSSNLDRSHDFVKQCEFNGDLSANKRVGSQLTTDTNGPFSFSRRARSTRRQRVSPGN